MVRMANAVERGQWMDGVRVAVVAEWQSGRVAGRSGRKLQGKTRALALALAVWHQA